MDQPRTLQQEALFAEPLTEGQRTVVEVMLGLTLGFTLWMLLGAPGVPRP